MLRLICFSLVQCTFLATGNFLLKVGLSKTGDFSLTWSYFKELASNWWMLGSGLFMLTTTIIWFYILKHYDFSLAYPMTGISYLFGTLASSLILHETVSPARWFGVLFIIVGVAFLAKSS
jgi:undecaprenyl phosphate-alpha-L-ara4N flippase subunit ArnE